MGTHWFLLCLISQASLVTKSSSLRLCSSGFCGSAYPEAFFMVSSLRLLCSYLSHRIHSPRFCPRLPGLLWTHSALWLVYGWLQPRASLPVVTIGLCTKGQAPNSQLLLLTFPVYDLHLLWNSFVRLSLSCWVLVITWPFLSPGWPGRHQLSSALLQVPFSCCYTGLQSRACRWISCTVSIHLVLSHGSSRSPPGMPERWYSPVDAKLLLNAVSPNTEHSLIHSRFSIDSSI